jgi:hypothetical protein
MFMYYYLGETVSLKCNLSQERCYSSSCAALLPTQTEEDLLCTAVVNGVIKVGIILRALVQNGLSADLSRVVDVGIGTRNRHVEAAFALAHNNHNNNLRVVLFRFFGVGSIAMSAFNRNLKNALGYQIAQAVSKSLVDQWLRVNIHRTSALRSVVTERGDS